MIAASTDGRRAYCTGLAGSRQIDVSQFLAASNSISQDSLARASVRAYTAGAARCAGSWIELDGYPRLLAHRVASVFVKKLSALSYQPSVLSRQPNTGLSALSAISAVHLWSRQLSAISRQQNSGPLRAERFGNH